MTILLAFIAVSLVGATVALLGWASAVPRMRAERRIALIADYGIRSVTPEVEVSGGRPFEGLAKRLGDLASGFVGGRDEDLRRELMAAGLYRMTPTMLMGYRVLAVILLPLLFALAAPESWAFPLKLLAVGYAVYCGWMGPMILVRRKARTRLSEIDFTLPNMIELIVVTVEAGLGFSSSLQAASERIKGPLGDELRLMLQEQEMGLSSTEALRNLAKRADTPAMRSFVRAIVQGQELGVSIGQIMRGLAVDLRKMRHAAAQERAHKAPVKMLFPMVFLLFPSMFIVLLGPAAIQLMSALGNL